jgi:hypothetical protein
MKKFLRQALLVGAGSIITLLAMMGLPTLGLALYGTAFRTAYADCELAKAHAASLNSLSLDSALTERLHKTEDIDELSCLDYRELRYRLQQFKVSSATLGLIETRVVYQTAGLRD